MMSNPYHELIPSVQRFNTLLADCGLLREIDTGATVLYQGKCLTVVAVSDDQLSLADAFLSSPVNPAHLVDVEQWRDDPSCLYLPGIESLLDLILRQSGHFPAMTPGVQHSQEVWQVCHPDYDAIVKPSLLEALFNLVEQILSRLQQPQADE